ncbi:MAG: Loki-CTERM sorting domain-containing protein [Promethearchaeota archaeon]
MKKNKRFSKRFLIYFLLAFPAMMLAGFLFANDVQARENIPELPHQNNNWHWHDDVQKDTILIWETEYKINAKKGAMNIRLLEMANITGFENKTRDYMGPGQLFSNVIAEQIFYNVSSKLLQSAGFSFNFSSFNYNSSRSPGWEPALYLPEGQYMPTLLPINDTIFDATVMEPIFYNAFFVASVYQNKLNLFDTSGSNPAQNRIWILNTTDGYYVNCTYFDNGTLNTGEAYLSINDGEGGYMDAYLKFNRVFEYNVTESINWSVKKGDEFYYGLNELDDKEAEKKEEYKYDEIKIVIDDIITENINVNFMYPLIQYYQVVYANISFWNWTSHKYELEEDKQIIGIANDLLVVNLQALMGEDDLSKAKGDLIAQNLNVTSFWDYNFTFGPLPQPNNNSWGWTLIEMLDGKDGNPTGTYFIIDRVEDGVAGGDHSDFDNATIVLSTKNMEGSLYDYESRGDFSIGDYFNIYNISEDRDSANFFIYPNGTTKEEVKFIFNNDTVRGMDFEEAIYHGEDQLILRNQSAGKEVDILYNMTTGFPIRWIERKDFRPSIVFFEKNTTHISGDTYMYELNPIVQRKDSTKMYINTTSPSMDLYWAFLDFNPSLIPNVNEIPGMPIYLDLYSNDSVHNVYYNISCEYDETKLGEIPESNITIYYFDNNSKGWYDLSPYPGFNLDIDNNLVSLTLPESSGIWMIAVGAQSAWSFGVDVGDLIIMEDEGYMINQSTGDYFKMVDLSIINITAKDTEQNWLYPDQWMLTLNYTQLFFNASTRALEPDPFMKEAWNIPLSAWNENGTENPINKFVLSDLSGGIPTVIPLKWGTLSDLDLIAKTLNTTFFGAVGTMLGLPTWDSQVWGNDVQKRMYFASSSGYFMDLYYYNNGTINHGEVRITLNMGNPWLMHLNLTSISSYNTTKTIEWGVSPGTVIYYGDKDWETKFEIYEISEASVNLGVQNGTGIKPYSSWMTFQNVWANIYTWNVTYEKWDYRIHQIIGAANDYFITGLGSYNQFFGIKYDGGLDIFPTMYNGKNVDGYLLADELSPWLYLWGFDTITERSTRHIKISGPGSVEWTLIFDNNTGINQFAYGWMMRHGELSWYMKFIKNYTSLIADHNIFTIETDLVENFLAEVNVTTQYANQWMIYSGMVVNPTNETLPGDKEAFFIDFTYNSSSNLDDLIVTVQLPPEIDVDSLTLQVWWWNLNQTKTSSQEWKELTVAGNDLDALIIDGPTNTIIIDFNIEGMSPTDRISGILGISIIYIEEEGGEEEEDSGGNDKEEGIPDLEIPGYNLFFLISILALMIAVLVRKKRRI